MMVENIFVERVGSIANVIFDRPEKRNAINYEDWHKLGDIVRDLSLDDEIRVVIFTGKEDSSFSAGADITDFGERRNNSRQAALYQEAFDKALDAIESLQIPTIAKIKGTCIGGGCELTLAMDIRIAADNAKFGIPAARLGIVIGYQEMRRLVAMIGPGNASYLLMSGRLIDASTALHFGLVNSVLSLSSIDEYVTELAVEISRLAPLSHKQHKYILQRVLKDPQLLNMSSEDRKIPFDNFDSDDFHEGYKAFQDRRNPVFKGR